MGALGSPGAVSDSYRILCKCSDKVPEKVEVKLIGLDAPFRSCKCTSAAFGGVTLWALAPEENGKSLVVGW